MKSYLVGVPIVKAVCLILFGMLNALAAAAARDESPRTASDVWITPRRNKLNGSGSRTDPFDGSTQRKFDAVMVTTPSGTHIHLGSGTFTTNSVTLKEGWWLDGVNKDKTTLRLADRRLTTNGPYQYKSVVEHYEWRGFLKYARVSNMTLDCNRDNQPTYINRWSGYLNGVSIATLVGRIENVRVLGAYAKPNEGFPLALSGSAYATAATSRLQIENCDVVSPRTGGIGKGKGGMTAISFWNQHGGHVSGSIKGCSVTDGTFAVAAYGGRQWENVDIMNNRAEDCAAAMVLDTENFKNVRISHNKFSRGRNWGLIFNGAGTYSNIVISDNTIEVVAGNGTCMGPISGSYKILHNTFIQRNPGKTALSSFGATNLTGEMSNNIIVEPVASDLRGAKSLMVHDNYDGKGKEKTLQ